MKNHSDLVWAKQKYAYYWPARIVETPPKMRKPEKNKICVFFFGTHQFGFVKKENVKDYQLFREQYASKCQNNCPFRRAVDEVDNIISDSQKVGLDVVKIGDNSNEKDVKDGGISSSSSVEYVNTVLLSPNDHTTNANVLFNQISEQIQKIWSAILTNNDQTEEMEFQLTENQPYSLKVAKIPANGSCLFGTLVHQLFGHKIDRNEHEEATKQLRQRVVEHISEHFSSFEGAIQCRVEDEYSLSIIEDNKKACQIFVNDYLSRDDCWGGQETIQAVQEMYRVNILIFRESSTYNYFQRFDEPNTRILMLAYRLGNKLNRHSHNHYDSVCNIDTDDIWHLVKFLAKKQQQIK